jgi:hypothetical protein
MFHPITARCKKFLEEFVPSTTDGAVVSYATQLQEVANRSRGELVVNVDHVNEVGCLCIFGRFSGHFISFSPLSFSLTYGSIPLG